ncbi:MAG: hypothetical protein MJ252_21770 [archaeon]|nr:hypothetical protein [archaeon]
MIKTNGTVSELKRKICETFKIKKVSPKNIRKRIKKLYDRYHIFVHNNSKSFFHMSCVEDNVKSYEGLIATNKQLYCGLCWKYDCNYHSPPESYFDDASCYNVKEYLSSYKKMFELALQHDDTNPQTFPKIIQEEISKNEEDKMIIEENNDEYIKLIINNQASFNQFLVTHKLQPYSSNINKKTSNERGLNEKNALRKSAPSLPEIHSDDTCGIGCFKKILKLGNEFINKLYSMHKEGLPLIYELYLPKLLQIFKYDPCSISKCLKLVSLDNCKSIGPTDGDIECYLIYLRIIQYDFGVEKILTQDVIDNFLKERSSDKRRLIEFQRLKHIKENAKKSKKYFINFLRQSYSLSILLSFRK